MAFVRHPFNPVLLLVISLLVLVQLSSVESRGRIEAFPSCVEIVKVDPAPYSVVKIHKNKVIWFAITFSKPVLMKKDSKERIFLSPNARGSRKKQTADEIWQNSTNDLTWMLKFTIRKPFYNYFGTKYKYVDLLVYMHV